MNFIVLKNIKYEDLINNKSNLILKYVKIKLLKTY